MVFSAAVRTLVSDEETDELGPGKLDKAWLQRWVHSHTDLINRDSVLPFLNRAKREIARRGRLDIDEVPPQHRFLPVRAKPGHADAWLTNRLISDFVKTDFISRYVFNKQGFYRDYETWSEARRSHVVDALKTTYLRDKAGLLERLYGLTD